MVLAALNLAPSGEGVEQVCFCLEHNFRVVASLDRKRLGNSFGAKQDLSTQSSIASSEVAYLPFHDSPEHRSFAAV